MDKYMTLALFGALATFGLIVMLLQPSNKVEYPTIYFYDANGNPDGWGEMR